MRKKLFLTLISLATLHAPLRAMQEEEFFAEDDETSAEQPVVAKAVAKAAALRTAVAKQATKAILIAKAPPAQPFGAVPISDDESDDAGDSGDTSGASQSSTPAQDTPPVAALPKKVAAVAAASPRTIAPASPAPAMKKAVQKAAPPKPRPEEAAAPEETVQVQVTIPTSVFDGLLSAISRGQRAVSKRMNPSPYVLDPKNPEFYAWMLQQIEAANSIKDLQPLLNHPQHRDAFKKLFDRRAYATDLERETISDIIRTGKTKDTDKLEDLSQLVDAAEESQNVCSAATRKVLALITQEAQNTVAMAQRAAQKLPRSGNLPAISEDGDNNG